MTVNYSKGRKQEKENYSKTSKGIGIRENHSFK